MVLVIFQNLLAKLQDIWRSFMLLVDAAKPQQYMVKINYKYWNFWRNSKLQGGRLMCSCRKTEAGSRIFAMLYCQKDSDSLTDLKYLKYIKKAPSSRTIKPESLPPIERDAIFHAYWVYFQLQEWSTLIESTLDPKDWEWRLVGASLVPVMTEEELVPNDLLKIIWCKCWVTSKNPCGEKPCSCHSKGLNCVVACRDYHGSGCQNGVTLEILVELQNDIEDRFDDNI